jgi:three-Cys-motif partner protein
MSLSEDAERFFSDSNLVPSFSFIDPFGYRGLSLKIIKGVIKDWGCDCVFFFNYNRINAGISNQVVSGHIEALFGKERADQLRSRLPGLTPQLREALILEELAAEIKSLGGTYVLPFTFKNSSATRTTHKLVFVSKSFKVYSIMKSSGNKGSQLVQRHPVQRHVSLLTMHSIQIYRLVGGGSSSYSNQQSM